MIANRGSILMRVLLFFVATFVVMIGAGMFRAMAPQPYQSLAWGAMSSVLLLVLSIAFLRWDARDASSIGLGISAASWKRLFIGVVIGFAVHAIQTVMLLLLNSNVTIARTTQSSANGVSNSILVALCTFVALSCMEELGFRGYALRRLEEALGRPIALIIGAIAFVVLHLAYGWPLMTAVLGVSTGALLFGFAALVSRGLAMPIGLHFAWNFFGWAIGEKETVGIWRIVVTDANAPNAQIVGTVSYLTAMLLGCSGFWWYDHRHRAAG